MSEFVEYNCDTNPYPSFGKKYAGEKAIISLTSWKARINTVSKTLFSLLQQCPGFHIVLVLSDEEFPKMMDELPENLKLFVDNELIEVLWVFRNYKSFKKVLFTMDKYRDVPIISADDDCVYTCNYAQELYDKWNKDKSINALRYEYGKFPQMQGPTSLYYGFGDKALCMLNSLSNNTVYKSEDDVVVYAFLKRMHCKISYVHKTNKKPYKFHDILCPLHSDIKKYRDFETAFNWSAK